MPSTARSSKKGFSVRHIATDENKEMVARLTSYGVNQNEICAVLKITVPTLHKHYRHEIDTAAVLANADVAQSLYRQATRQTNPNVVAGIFWMKTRGGWTEKRPLDEDRDTTVNIKITGGLPDDE